MEDLDRAHAVFGNRVVLRTVHHGLVPRSVCLSTGMHFLEITKTLASQDTVSSGKGHGLMFQERSAISPLSSTRALRRLKDPSSAAEGLRDPTERPSRILIFLLNIPFFTE